MIELQRDVSSVKISQSFREGLPRTDFSDEFGTGLKRRLRQREW